MRPHPEPRTHLHRPFPNMLAVPKPADPTNPRPMGAENLYYRRQTYRNGLIETVTSPIGRSPIAS